MWEDRETCWISNIPQGTQEWKNLRYCSISSSNISECVGRSNYYNSTDLRSENEKKIDLAMVLCGLNEKKFTKESKIHMERGTYYEPFIRNFHFQKLRDSGLDCEMKELGIAIWKKDPRFRGSVDGEIGNFGISEYKCVKSMYKALVEYTDAVSRGYKPQKNQETEHIYKSHLDQMTLNSIILDKKWCEYCVVCIDTKQTFIQRIDTNYDLWNNILYPQACEFYDTYMTPIINEHNLKLVMP